MFIEYKFLSVLLKSVRIYLVTLAQYNALLWVLLRKGLLINFVCGLVSL